MEKTYPHEQLEGPRLRLRRYDLAAAPALLRCLNADRARLEGFLPWVREVRQLEDVQEFLRSGYLQWQEGVIFDFGIFLLGSEELLGNLSCHAISWPDERCELGYWLASAHEGQGYMSEAVRMIGAELFRLGFHRLEIRCDALNEKSAAVPKRCGFSLEGLLREDVWERGRRRDSMVWGKVRRA